ncbi:MULTISPECIES: recombinase family protein [Enterobacteriaceae]|uniref:recombinase family protein n=1 Tax=Enterobacteriaceae TaxID=543 RepID=UPI001928D249|nr:MULTISPECIES: recombinase family protein [Enterobacteriaceae]HAV1978734.1 recombinase family protein [Enterobacter hormaechei subsp. steigerwaltii]MCO7986304.1 recombinase family protein [Escherichia fergusonii]MCQ9485708.1 recombinase family protein [Enterobacter cloacae]MCQ9526719.1 recombinase family protein [Enterobacter cloacae]MCQ9569307.1 recombinase family protein [Enterobacter cloacae]
MTIYAYTRVSKAENETGTTDNQIINIESQLKIDNVYSDVNISGSMPFQKRPEAQKLVSVLKSGDIVVIAKLDRGFRDTADCLNTVKWLQKRNVTLRILDIALDVSTPIGEMILTIMASVATFERKRIAERIKDGFANGRKQGKSYGYKLEAVHRSVAIRSSKRRQEALERYDMIRTNLSELIAQNATEAQMLAHLGMLGQPVSRTTLRNALGK